MRIGIIGTGYVGLVSGVMLTTLGHNVICIDKDKSKLARLLKGDCIIYEIGLAEKLKNSLQNSLISFSSDYSDISDMDAVFVCVGTPSGMDGGADLSYVYSAIDELIGVIKKECLIVIKSTVPPSTCSKIQEYIYNKNLNYKIASNPEFLREGSAVYDFENPDRIIMGGDEESCNLLIKIYQKQIERNVPIVKTSTTTSELIKYASNSFLAVKLSFINEMSDLCEKIDADVETLSIGMGLDKRIGSLFLKAGPGYGGSCFPKDTLALQKLAKDSFCDLSVLESAITSNLARYELMKNKILNICKMPKKLTIFGAAFKAGTDDIRESPAVHIIKLLALSGIEIYVYDPIAIGNFRNLNITNTESFDSPYDACKDSDGIIILTEWNEFKSLDYEKIYHHLNKKVILDLRRILDEIILRNLGFEYYTLGKKTRIKN
jgi:UDPglucose 6-dehydrogenase